MLPGSFKLLAEFSPSQAFPYSSGIYLLTPRPPGPNPSGREIPAQTPSLWFLTFCSLLQASFMREKEPVELKGNTDARLFSQGTVQKVKM